MATNKSLKDFAIRHQVFLERLKTSEVNNFSKVLLKVDKAMRDIMSQLTQQKMSDVSRTRLNALLGEMRAAQLEIMNKQLETFIGRLPAIGEYEAEFEVKSLTNGTKVKASALTTPDSDAVFAFAQKQPLASTGELLNDFLSNWSTTQVAALNNTIRQAYARGWTVQQTVQALRGTKAQNFKDGLIGGKMQRDLTAAVRTSLQHVSSMARLETWNENSDVVDKYRWVSTLDSLTTPQCRSLDGQEFELGDGPMPPIHINCRSTTVAVVDDQYAYLDEGATRSSASGYVDADETYYEWLNTQPAAFQDEALGPTRGQLFREGGLTVEEFGRLNINRNFEPMTLDEMRKKEPAAFEKAGI